MITVHLHVYDINRWRVQGNISILNDVHDTELGKTLAFPTFFIKKIHYTTQLRKSINKEPEFQRYSEHAYRFLKHI